MKSRSFLILAVATLVAVVAAVWLAAEREAVTERSAGEPLFAGLADRLNEIESVHVLDAETDTGVTLERTDEGWGVVDRWGYPANMTDLRRQLIALADARLVEAKTRNPENYDHLGVEDPQAEGAASRLVRLQFPGETVNLIVGDTSFRGATMTYVRRPDEEQSWAASGNLAMDSEPESWLRKDVVDIPVGDVRRVQLTHPDGDVVEIFKEKRELPNYQVRTIPEGRELVSPSAGNSIAGALGSLRLEDVVAEEEFDAGDQQPVEGMFETFDGLRVTTRAWQLDDSRYVALQVSYDPELVVAEVEEAESAVEGDGSSEDQDQAAADAAEAPEDASGSDSEPAADDADDTPDSTGDDERAANAEEPLSETVDPKQRAAELNQVVAGWVYKVPSYKYSNLTKRMEDLLKPAEETTETAD